MLRALALLPHEALPRQQYLPVMMEVPRLSRPVVKGVNWEAQNHQGPQGLHVLRALALLPHEG